MNRKQIGILIVLLIVIGGAGWLVQRNRDKAAGAGEAGTGQKLMGEHFPINDVEQIGITQGTNALDLVKKDGIWRVSERSDYPANFSQISDFLIKAGDLRVIQTEQIGPSQLSRMQLAPPGNGTNSGIVVDLKSKDGKAIRTLTLGKKHVHKPESQQQQQQFMFGEEADGRYVQVGADTKDALLIADPLNSLEPKPEQWLDKDFFKVERPKEIAVAFPAATNSWKIARDKESGDWQLADAKGDEKLDQARATGVSSPFSSPSFNDVLPRNAKDTGMENPTVVTIDTFDDLTYTVKVGAKNGENYPMTMTVAEHFPKERIPAKDEKPEDKTKADAAWKTRHDEIEKKFKEEQAYENWTYLVPTWNVDPILKDRKDLLAVVEKKEEPKKDEPKPATNVEPVEKPDGSTK